MGESIRYAFKRVHVWSHVVFLAALGVMLLVAHLRAQIDCPGCPVEHRITSIETRLDTIEQVGKAIMGLLAAQLVVLLFKNVGRRQDGRGRDWR